MVFLFRLLIVLLLLRIILRFLGGVLRGYCGAQASPRPREIVLVRDPVCLAFIPRDRALRAIVSGHEKHFCSEACRRRARGVAGTNPL
jgi:YHS domain-containing protein